MKLAKDYAETRVAFDRPIVRFQAIKHKIVEMATEIEMARHLTYHALWLFSHFVSPFWGGVIGFVWILGRIAFAWGYYRDAKQRAAGFAIGTACSLILLLGALAGMVRVFL